MIHGLTAAGLFVSVLVTANATSHAATPNPRAVNLNLSDLPSGFTQVPPRPEWYLPNPQVELNLASSKNLVAYSAEEFIPASSYPKAGIIEVSSFVGAYRTTSDARDQVANYDGHNWLVFLAGQGRSIPYIKHEGWNGLGQGQTVFRVSVVSQGHSSIELGLISARQGRYILDDMLFWRMRYLVEVVVLYKEQENLPQAIAFAHLIDNRIKEYG